MIPLLLTNIGNTIHIINNVIPDSILSEEILFFCIYIPPYVLYYPSKFIDVKQEHITSPITQTINMPTRILITL